MKVRWTISISFSEFLKHQNQMRMLKDESAKEVKPRKDVVGTMVKKKKKKELITLGETERNFRSG